MLVPSTASNPSPSPYPNYNPNPNPNQAFLIFGVGGFAMLLGDDLHRRAAPRAEFGWPIEIGGEEGFGRVEMGRKPLGTTGVDHADQVLEAGEE
eukprot:scaffold75671_cov37-Phaeocystis_antarctica.AAC.1